MNIKPLFPILILFLSISWSSIIRANICIEIELPESDHYTFDDSLAITSYDGTVLAANVLTPKSSPDRDGFPAIIFINSWALDEHEYLLQAAQFAQKGYVVLSYSSRGWGCSGGQVQTLGQGDMDDLSSMVDYLQSRDDVDANNIGVSGVSYGSGISLKGLAVEPRIKTAVAMSTWGSLEEALYDQETPQQFWGFLLTVSGDIIGDLDPQIQENFFDLLQHDNVDAVRAWAAERSPINYIHLINERQAPVYMANSFGDELFKPNGVLNVFQRLTGPRRLDLNQGTHVSAEGFGLVGLDNYTWRNTHDWFDYWLKGENTGIMDKPPLTMLTDLQQRREEYADYPVATRNETFYLGASGQLGDGKLQRVPFQPGWPLAKRIWSGRDSGASTGIPALSALLEGHLRLPVYKPMDLINRVHGMVFDTSRLDDQLKIRGVPNVSLRVTPSRHQVQLIAYLYDVDGFGMGKLITHGPLTLHDAAAGEQVDVQLDLVATAYDVPADHRLAIAFDTFDLLYAVPTLSPYSVDFNFAKDTQSILEVPVVD